MIQSSQLDVGTTGIRFPVTPSFRFGSQRTMSTHTCFVSNQTLNDLAARRLFNSYLPEEVFRRYEQEITGIAARLAQAGVSGAALVVRYENFTALND